MAIRYGRGDVKQTTTGFRDPRHHICQKQIPIPEHDHKYVTTRDPSKFYSFQAPANKIVNKAFYENANCVVVLSEICKEVLFKEYKER